jgi:cytochrome b6-f complex iron-sulfur subunit
MNRRDLIQRVLTGGAVLILVPSVFESCSKGGTNDPAGPAPGSKITLDLTLPANAALSNAGGSLITQEVIVINTGGGNYSALSAICTHQGCIVGYNSGTGNIQCPCHGSVYTTGGIVVTGPAPSPLTKYPVTLSGNILTITL